MAFTDRQREELDQLIFALRDQTLDRDGYAKLERLVLVHAEARERFVVSMHLQGALHWRYAGRPAAAVVPAETVELPSRVARRRKQAARQRKVTTTGMAIAASMLVIVGGVTAWVWKERSANHLPAVARVTKVSGAQWRSAQASEGSALSAGRRLDLASGIVELAFASGVRVILAGPVVFDVVSTTRGKLETGMVTAKAPPELKGFTVETPGLTVVDLGTEFGVRADADGFSEVHVFDGEVEATVTKNTKRKIMLTERQAIQSDLRTGTLNNVVFDDEHFVRDVARGPVVRAVPQSFAEPFDAVDHLQLQPGYKTVGTKIELSAEHREGRAAVEVNWQAAADNYGVIYLARKVPLTDITGCSFEMWVKPQTQNSGYWGIELYDDRGRIVEQHRVFVLKVGTWNRLVFQQGKKREGGYLNIGPGNRQRVSKVVFRAQTRENGQAASDLWDDFKLTRPK